MVVPMQVSAVGCGYWGGHLSLVLIAPQGRGHIDAGSAPPRSEQRGCNTPDPPSAGKDSKILNWRGHEDRGPGVRQPSKTASERTLSGGQDGGDADDLVQSGRSRGKSRCSGYTMVRVDHYQSRREIGLAGHLGTPHIWLVSRRGKPKYLVPSKPSRDPFPFSMLGIRYILTVCSRTFPDYYISRTLPPLRTRLKYFAHALLN